MSEPSAANKFSRSGRRAGRLAAVQALYEMEMTDAALDPVLEEFMAERWHNIDTDRPEQKAAGRGVPRAATRMAKPDLNFLSEVVKGVCDRQGELDERLSPCLSSNMDLQGLETLLRAILRCGAYEILCRNDVPAGIVVSEYTDVAEAFYADGSKGLVNGVLDNLARNQTSDGDVTDEAGSEV